MYRTLILLILAVIVLSWNFIFTDKKVVLTTQARVLQGLSSAINHKTAVEQYWQQNGILPDNRQWLGASPKITVDLSKTIVKSIEVGLNGPGVISVFYTVRPGLGPAADIDGRKINLIPVVENEKIVWICKGTIGANHLPGGCSQMAGDG